MSDLLSRLIARASGPVSPIQPVLPSRFEPAPMMDEIPVVAEAAERRIERSIERVQEKKRATEPTATRVTTRFEIERGSPDRAKGQEQHLPEAKASLRIDPLEPTPGREETRAFVEKRQVVNSEIAPPDVRVQIGSNPLVEPASVGEHRHPTIPSSGTPARSKPHSFRSGEISSSAPDVQVTIGHVELRMIAPAPQPAQPRRPATPRVTLDDYLKRKNGESR